MNQTARGEIADGGLGHIRGNRARAERYEHRRLMRIAHIAAFHGDGHGGALLRAHEVLLQRGDGQQRGQRGVMLVKAAVAQHDDGHALRVQPVAFVEQPLQRALHALMRGGIDEQRYRGGAQAVLIQRLDALHVACAQHGRGQLDHAAGAFVGGEQIAVIAQIDRRIGAALFAQRVDGRVGHLREPLLKVGKQRRMRLGERRQRYVRAHGADGLRALFGHGDEHAVIVLIGIAQRLGRARVIEGRSRVAQGQVAQMEHALFEPLFIGQQRGEMRFQLVAFIEPALMKIGADQLAAAQTAAPQDMRFLLAQYARFRREDEPSVVGFHAAQGAQAVAVEHGQYAVAVEAQQRRRAVPRLHERGIIVIHRLPGRFFRAPLPGLGHQDHAGQRQRHAVHRKELQRVVQHGRVRTGGIDDGVDRLRAIAQQAGGHRFLARQHAVGIAADGVDFAVVQQHPVRVRLAPAGIGVGGKARVHQRRGGGIVGLLKIGIERAQLRHQHHALVDDCARGQRADIRLGRGLLKAAAQHIQPAVERRAALSVLRACHKALHDRGHALPRAAPEQFGTDRHIAPGDEGEAFRAAGGFERGFLGGCVGGEEEHGRAVIALIAQINPLRCRPAAEQGMGNLRHNAHAVAGRALRVAARAVRQPLHDGQCAVNRAMIAFSIQIDDRADAAGLVLHALVIQRIELPHARSPLNNTDDEFRYEKRRRSGRPCASALAQHAARAFGHLDAMAHALGLEKAVRLFLGEMPLVHELLLGALHQFALLAAAAGQALHVQLHQHVDRGDQLAAGKWRCETEQRGTLAVVQIFRPPHGQHQRALAQILAQRIDGAVGKGRAADQYAVAALIEGAHDLVAGRADAEDRQAGGFQRGRNLAGGLPVPEGRDDLRHGNASSNQMKMGADGGRTRPPAPLRNLSDCFLNQ